MEKDKDQGLFGMLAPASVGLAVLAATAPAMDEPGYDPRVSSLDSRVPSYHQVGADVSERSGVQYAQETFSSLLPTDKERGRYLAKCMASYRSNLRI